MNYKKNNLLYQSKFIGHIFFPRLMVFVSSPPLYSCFRCQINRAQRYFIDIKGLKRKYTLKANLWYKHNRKKKKACLKAIYVHSFSCKFDGQLVIQYFKREETVSRFDIFRLSKFFYTLCHKCCWDGFITFFSILSFQLI